MDGECLRDRVYMEDAPKLRVTKYDCVRINGIYFVIKEFEVTRDGDDTKIELIKEDYNGNTTSHTIDVSAIEEMVLYQKDYSGFDTDWKWREEKRYDALDDV